LLQDIKIKEIQKEDKLKTEFYKRLNSICIPGLISTYEDKKKNPSDNNIKLTEKDWNKVTKNTDAIFNKFTKRLKNNFPKINEMDVRLCCLIKIQFKIQLRQSDIANIMNVEKDSIKKRKQRIRKDKMMIEDGRTLDEIISTF